MSLLGSIGGAVAGFASGGPLGAVAGGLTSGALGANVATGRGAGFQLAGFTPAQAKQYKALGLTPQQALAGNQTRIAPAVMPTVSRIGASPLTTSLAGSGVAGATSLVGASSLNPLGQIIAGIGAGAQTALGLSGSVTNQGLFLNTAAGKSATGKKRRRMNPMNIRAARRAIRRIRSARKILMRIERSMPKARTHHRSPRR